MKIRSLHPIVWYVALLGACGLLASPAWALPSPSRTLEEPRGLGSAIAPIFSLDPHVLRPFESSAVMACVTNQNPRSHRSVETGDELRFELTGGALASCAGVVVAPADSALDADAFACEIDDSTIVLRRTGESVRWPAGDAVCATLALTPGPATFVTRTSVVAGNRGAWSPVSPASLLVSVGPALGIPGPPGPEGPVGSPGPAGPPGTGGIGARAFAVSNDFAVVHEGEPPVLVPGLEVSLSTSDGSQLMIIADVAQWECDDDPSGADGVMYVEVDGTIVASRTLNDWYQHVWAANVPWLSPSMPAGTHVVRVLVGGTGTHALGAPIPCIGGPLHEDQPTVSRVLALEVLP